MLKQESDQHQKQARPMISKKGLRNVNKKEEEKKEKEKKVSKIVQSNKDNTAVCKEAETRKEAKQQNSNQHENAMLIEKQKQKGISLSSVLPKHPTRKLGREKDERRG